MVTVILNSKGFADLLERGDFMQRVSEQDQKIVTLVRNAKADAQATEQHLNGLETRQRAVTQRILANRNAIAQGKQDLIDTRVGYAGTRSDKQHALMSVRQDRRHLEGALSNLKAQQAKIALLCRSSTRLPLKVQLLMVSVAWSAKMPAPDSAKPLLIVRPTILTTRPGMTWKTRKTGVPITSLRSTVN